MKFYSQLPFHEIFPHNLAQSLAFSKTTSRGERSTVFWPKFLILLCACLLSLNELASHCPGSKDSWGALWARPDRSRVLVSSRSQPAGEACRDSVCLGSPRVGWEASTNMRHGNWERVKENEDGGGPCQPVLMAPPELKGCMSCTLRVSLAIILGKEIGAKQS